MACGELLYSPGNHSFDTHNNYFSGIINQKDDSTKHDFHEFHKYGEKKPFQLKTVGVGLITMISFPVDASRLG